MRAQFGGRQEGEQRLLRRTRYERVPLAPDEKGRRGDRAEAIANVEG
jgi:hypothetical protein